VEDYLSSNSNKLGSNWASGLLMIPYGKIYNIFLSIENPKWPPVRHSFLSKKNVYSYSHSELNNAL
jgi:hypothetical protein